MIEYLNNYHFQPSITNQIYQLLTSSKLSMKLELNYLFFNELKHTSIPYEILICSTWFLGWMAEQWFLHQDVRHRLADIHKNLQQPCTCLWREQLSRQFHKRWTMQFSGLSRFLKGEKFLLKYFKRVSDFQCTVLGQNGRAVVHAQRHVTPAYRHTQEPVPTLHLQMEGIPALKVQRRKSHATPKPVHQVMLVSHGIYNNDRFDNYQDRKWPHTNTFAS